VLLEGFARLRRAKGSAIQGGSSQGYRALEAPLVQLVRGLVFAFYRLILCILACDSGAMERQDHYIKGHFSL
jgi:hypothetical protein